LPAGQTAGGAEVERGRLVSHEDSDDFAGEVKRWLDLAVSNLRAKVRTHVAAAPSSFEDDRLPFVESP
jgi:hypothetical protein